MVRLALCALLLTGCAGVPLSCGAVPPLAHWSVADQRALAAEWRALPPTALTARALTEYAQARAHIAAQRAEYCR